MQRLVLEYALSEAGIMSVAIIFCSKNVGAASLGSVIHMQGKDMR